MKSKMRPCEVCTNFGYLGQCKVMEWLRPGSRPEDAPDECLLWKPHQGDVMATLNHRLDLIDENEGLRRLLAKIGAA
jgi:hypothetical protein